MKSYRTAIYTAQKMNFSMKDFFSKCHQICRKLWIWSHLLKKSLLENFIFCAVILECSLSLSHTRMLLFIFYNVGRSSKF